MTHVATCATCQGELAALENTASELAYAAAMGVPAGMLGDPADFGSIVAFLCSEQARFTTGVQLHVDGGAYAGLQ